MLLEQLVDRVGAVVAEGLDGVVFARNLGRQQRRRLPVVGRRPLLVGALAPVVDTVGKIPERLLPRIQNPLHSPPGGRRGPVWCSPHEGVSRPRLHTFDVQEEVLCSRRKHLPRCLSRSLGRGCVEDVVEISPDDEPAAALPVESLVLPERTIR